MPDTAAYPPVGSHGEGGTVICGVHEEVVNNLNTAIQTRASKTLLLWTLAVFSTVGMAFGGTIWVSTSSSLDKQDDKIQAIQNRTLTMEIEFRHIKAELQDVKAEQKSMRNEFRNEFEKLRKLIKENGNGG